MFVRVLKRHCWLYPRKSRKTETVVHRCSSKNVFLKIRKFRGKHLCWSLFLIKLQAFLQKHLKNRTTQGDCFWKKGKSSTLRGFNCSILRVSRKDFIVRSKTFLSKTSLPRSAAIMIIIIYDWRTQISFYLAFKVENNFKPILDGGVKRPLPLVFPLQFQQT